jgi:hypothetical protein
MSTVYKTLGQLANGTANAVETVYTVPVGTSTVVSTVNICNTTTGAVTFRLWTCGSGDGTGVKNAAYYDIPMAGNDTFQSTAGATLGAGATVQFTASGTGVGVQLYGMEMN